jgi:hypothetical protein
MSRLMNTHKMTFALLATAMAVALVFAAVVPAVVSSASAAIQCVNPGGQNPQGNCQGANERQNPAGQAPPGQNK